MAEEVLSDDNPPHDPRRRHRRLSRPLPERQPPSVDHDAPREATEATVVGVVRGDAPILLRSRAPPLCLPGEKAGMEGGSTRA